MSKIYRALISATDKFVPSKLRPLWEHEAGPKTIFFWAPAFKWALVAASIDDYRRPLDKVSTTQSATLSATGLIWTRYCLVIRPINYSLSICNFALGVANGIQCVRAYRYQNLKA
ncbi:PREDICTED: mitochondrial pyruvate carrier 2-like isoform X2 [Papilio polytes]|uniref:mitochondrial pyruvate carrier 2-like isoform X2 n=1 Tax=Papilio polytes TaxID=76194 RepID=UPI000675E0F8|nr:PREDICTED: mitochondrial pyruvate carrier 2-like isoform X2 [Papilio polytes]